MTDKPAAPAPQLPFSSVPMPADFHPQIAPPNLQPAPIQNTQQKPSEVAPPEPRRKGPPGCPPGPPPDLFSLPELDSDYESEDSEDDRKSPISKRRRYSSDRSDSSSQSDDDQKSASDSETDVPKPTSVQQRILAIAGQKYDDFMKELENVHKKDRNNSTSDEKQSKSQDDRSRSDSSSDSDSRSDNEKSTSDDRRVEESKKEENYKSFEEPPRRDNPAAIPNISSVPTPPMLPILKLPNGPPPPPMGKSTLFTKIRLLFYVCFSR